MIENVPNTSPITLQNAPHYLSFHQWYGGSGSSSRFAGLIDDVKIYSRSISTSEIKKLYNASQPVSGTVKSLSKIAVTCKNNTSGQIVNISTTNATAYNCEEKGLDVNIGEDVSITINGKVQ